MKTRIYAAVAAIVMIGSAFTSAFVFTGCSNKKDKSESSVYGTTTTTTKNESSDVSSEDESSDIESSSKDESSKNDSSKTTTTTTTKGGKDSSKAETTTTTKKGSDDSNGGKTTTKKSTEPAETTKKPETTPAQTTYQPDTEPAQTNPAPQTTPAPETTKKPETTPAPETTKKPETTKPAETTPAPATDPTPQDPSVYNEFKILANMYAKGYVPVGTYSGSYAVEDSNYGLIFVFYGTNRNGGSGTSHSAPYNYTEDSLLDSPSMNELKSAAKDVWNNGTYDDIMSGTGLSKDYGYAYFIAAILDGNNQYSGAILAPVN